MCEAEQDSSPSDDVQAKKNLAAEDGRHVRQRAYARRAKLVHLLFGAQSSTRLGGSCVTLELRRALAEQLSEGAIRPGKNLEALVIDMLETG